MDPPTSRWRLATAALAAAAAAACSGRGGADPGPIPGSDVLVAKPGGGWFVTDPHRGGKATRLTLLEIGWGRLVDVHDVGPDGRPSALPLLRDRVIGEDVLSDGFDLTLETHPVTHRSRLIVHRTAGAPDDGTGTFGAILSRASTRLAAIVPKKDDGTATLPVSYAARDACLVLRFDDLLEDGPETRAQLHELVRLLHGYPPTVPYPARIVFDPTFGGLAGGAFHSTRVLVDLSISPEDALELPFSVPVNPAGLPAGARDSQAPNASLRIVTRLDPPSGRFARLTNLAGRGLEPTGPVDPASQDLVRAFRGGNADDANGGFLLDLSRPRLLGGFELAIEAARDAPSGPAGFAFEADVRFTTSCRVAPAPGDTLELGGELYEVRAPAPEPDFDGHVAGVELLRLTSAPLGSAAALLGAARLLTPYRETPLAPACWITLVPRPGRPPAAEVDSDARIVLRFSEPMDPDTFRAFDTFRVLRGREDGEPLTAEDLVVGTVRVEADLQQFHFLPRLPLANHAEPEYRVELVGGVAGVRDLSGGTLEGTFARAEIVLDPDQPPVRNSGIALRFATDDEIASPGAPDLRGQVTRDEERGVLRPRFPAIASYAADRGVPLVARMFGFGRGVQTPLSPLGSKLQALWRYCDFGWRVRDENFHNVDLVGMSWSPLGGQLVADYFPLFELRLSHSRWIPDETILTSGVPKYGLSGLSGAPERFDSNQLEPQTIVHPRGYGYRIRPSDLALNPTGTPLLAFPWNRAGAPQTSFTWRDTAVLAKYGQGSPGVPLDIEVDTPLFLDQGQGEVGGAGDVPSIGLPLLWEVRCFPTSAGLGFNSLDIVLPLIGWATPNFRAFSTGGVNQSGQVVTKDPDLELRPSGGFNPNSRPPGLPTPLTADNSFYIGQIETVIRISRAVTVWIDTGTFDPTYVQPVVEPRQQPGTSAIQLDFRGATDVSLGFGDPGFDAAQLDFYGDVEPGIVTHLGDGSWSSDIRSVDGARFLQIRFTFVNDVEGRLFPELDSVGVAYEVQ